MGRTVVYEDNVQERINSLLRQKSYQHGFLIGQSIPQRDYVIHLTQTPAREEPTADIEDDGKESPESSPSKKPPKGKIESLKDMDEEWICHHAKQVTRMLPGGIDILGLFVIAPMDAFTSSQAVLKQILNSTFRTLSKELKYVICAENAEKILLHICSITQKITCKTLDVIDNKQATLRPADWKLQSGALRWHRLDCQFSLNMKVPISKERSKQNLLKQIQVGLNPLFQSICSGITLLNRQMRDGSELLDARFEGRKGRSKESTLLQTYAVDLLLPMTLNNNELWMEVMECASSMTFLGTIQGRAYVHQKATVDEATKAMKQDIIRSIAARCEIHCEDLLLIDEEQEDPTVVHKLPKRIFAPLMNSGVTVCDYLFHEDSARDSLDAFRELLDLTVSEDSIEADSEQLPPTHELIETDGTDDDACSATNETLEGKALISQFGLDKKFPLMGMAMAGVIVGMSYLYFQQQ